MVWVVSCKYNSEVGRGWDRREEFGLSDILFNASVNCDFFFILCRLHSFHIHCLESLCVFLSSILAVPMLKCWEQYS